MEFKKREPLSKPFSLRLPVSMVETISKLSEEFNIPQSDIYREIMEKGLAVVMGEVAKGK